MIIASFTTSPSRIHKCEAVINSILNQTTKPDLFLLNIPKKYRGKDKYKLPKFLEGKVTLNVLDKDYGPGTKIIGALIYCRENDIQPSKFIYFDDDVLYPEGMIASMLECSKKGLVVGASCFDFLRSNTIGCFHDRTFNYQIVEGFGGVCLDAADTDGLIDFVDSLPDTNEIRTSDDLYLSLFYHEKKCFLSDINMPGVYSFQKLWSEGRILEYGNGDDALHMQGDDNIKRYAVAAEQISKGRTIKMPNLTFKPK